MHLPFELTKAVSRFPSLPVLIILRVWWQGPLLKQLIYF